MTDTAYGERSVAGVDDVRPARRSAPLAWAATAVATALVVALTGVYVQVLHPFVRHDDWAFTLGTTEPGAVDLWARQEFEGRWLGWAYWSVVGRHTSVVTASVVLLTAHVAYVWGLVRLLALRRPVHVFLATSALLVSVVWVQLVYWPGSLSASMVVLALSVWSLPVARRRPWALAGWVLVFVPLAVLGYPPVAALAFLALAVTEVRSSVRRLLVLGVGYVASYGLGVALVGTFNLLAFGRFGLTIPDWRRPNPLTSVAALEENLGRYGTQVGALGVTLGVAWVVGLVCAVWAVVDPLTRRAAVVLLGATAVVVGMEGGLTAFTGIISGVRGSLWAWPALCLAAALLLAGTRWSRVAGAVALVVLATVGTFAWRADLGEHQIDRVRYEAIGDEAAALEARTGGPVVKWQDPAGRASAAGSMTQRTLSYMLSDQHGIWPDWCRPAECRRIADAVRQNPSADVLEVDGLVVVVVPDPPPWMGGPPRDRARSGGAG